MANQPDRNIGLEIVRVTESAALAAARWMGRGDKNSADKAAVDAIRMMLDSIAMDGVVVIGEGEKDKAPMLFNGERIGRWHDAQRPIDDPNIPLVDLAVDPIDGTRLLSRGAPNARACVGARPR